MLAQQRVSKLLARVRQESEMGERVAFDQVGVVSVKERTVRHADTQYINTPHRKRWVTMKDYDIADLRDAPDLVKILNDPVGEYARAFVAAFNRQQDKGHHRRRARHVLYRQDGPDGGHPAVLTADRRRRNGLHPGQGPPGDADPQGRIRRRRGRHPA